MFSLRQEADVYQVKDKLKQQLNKEIKKSNHASGKFYSINPINRSALETIGKRLYLEFSFCGIF